MTIKTTQMYPLNNQRFLPLSVLKDMEKETEALKKQLREQGYTDVSSETQIMEDKAFAKVTAF